MLEVDWFGRTYGWTPDQTLSASRRIMADLRVLRSYRKTGGGEGDA